MRKFKTQEPVNIYGRVCPKDIIFLSNPINGQYISQCGSYSLPAEIIENHNEFKEMGVQYEWNGMEEELLSFGEHVAEHLVNLIEPTYPFSYENLKEVYNQWKKNR